MFLICLVSLKLLFLGAEGRGGCSWFYIQRLPSKLPQKVARITESSKHGTELAELVCLAGPRGLKSRCVTV